MQKCAWASAVGNYPHAKFENPMALTTIQERVSAVSKLKHLTEQHTAAIASEYIAAKMPVHPFRAAPDISWDDFVERAIYDANVLIRGCKGIPEPRVVSFTPIELPEADKIYYDNCLMPTGHNSTWICTTCFGISAPVAKRFRGFRQIPVPIDPWGPPMSENPPVYCPVCKTTRLRFIDLHGLFICLGRKFSIVVCPEPACNMVTIKTGPLTTTVCNKCLDRKAGMERICYKQKHKIRPDDWHAQLALDLSKGEVFLLDSCEFHNTEDVEVMAYTQRQL
eukprot:m.7310 g.7310  ORF g.7310 m.7310 type:complete len:279 (-) comp2181_c0_seq2:360-1196(-)